MMMTLQQRLQQASPPIVQPQSVSAPITGWNTRDALDAMPPTDAVQLDNWYPDADGVYVRNGYQSFATGASSAQVQTLAAYDGATKNKLFACAGTVIYEVTGGGAAVSRATGFTSAKWQTANFKNYLFMVNGVDTPQTYSGTSFGDSGWSGVTGGEHTLIGVFPYQQVLYFWQQNAQGFWYGGVGAVTGALNYFDLSQFSYLGGTIVTVTSFSYDGGNGVLDYIGFVMSSGDVFVYQGDDPSNANVFSYSGRYRISPPLGIRAVCNYGGESFLTTFDDHVPLRQQLASLQTQSAVVALSGTFMPARSKVSNAVQAAAIANPNGFGWQSLFYPEGRFILFNIPNADGTFDQHIVNTVNQAWCRFVNMNGCCWVVFNGGLYFGGAAGGVYQANVGNMDLMGPTTAYAQQAWNMLESPLRKRATAVRPIIQSVGGVAYSFGINWDYNPVVVPVISGTPSIGSPWNTSPWNTSPWSAETQINTSWKIGGGTGQSIAWGLQVSALQPITWLRTDLRLEIGNAL